MQELTNEKSCSFDETFIDFCLETSQQHQARIFSIHTMKIDYTAKSILFLFASSSPSPGFLNIEYIGVACVEKKMSNRHTIIALNSLSFAKMAKDDFVWCR